MKSFGNFHNDVATGLQNYFHYCSLEMSCAGAGANLSVFADRGIAPHLDALGYCAHPVPPGECPDDDQRHVPECW